MFIKLNAQNKEFQNIFKKFNFEEIKNIKDNDIIYSDDKNYIAKLDDVLINVTILSDTKEEYRNSKELNFYAIAGVE